MELKTEESFKHDLVPQVVETNIHENLPPNDSIGFIYLWTNLTTKRWYLGKRNGPPRSGYLFSSTQKDFLIDFTNPNYTWRYDIMTYVTTNKTDLTNLEHGMLSTMHDPETGEGGATKNPMSYNKSNGIPVKTKEPNVKKVQLLAQRIINGEFPIRLKVEITVLLQMIIAGYRVQSRRKDLNKHQLDIAGAINDDGGITDPCPSDCNTKHNHIVGCDPVVMLHNVTYNNMYYEDLIVDGSQTIQGASRSDKAVYLRVLDVPTEETENFTSEEFVMLGNALNPPQKKKKIATDRDDFEDYIEGAYYNSNVPVKSENNRKIGKEIHGLHSKTIDTAILAVKNKIKKDQRFVKTGEVFCDYDTPAYKKRLEAALRKHNNLNGVHCISAKTNFYKIIDTIRVLDTLLLQKKEDSTFNIHELRVLAWHKDPETEKLWTQKRQAEYEGYNERIFNHCGIDLTFKYMPSWSEDIADV